MKNNKFLLLLFLVGIQLISCSSDVPSIDATKIIVSNKTSDTIDIFFGTLIQNVEPDIMIDRYLHFSGGLAFNGYIKISGDFENSYLKFNRTIYEGNTYFILASFNSFTDSNQIEIWEWKDK